jgi:hypothetical protein
MVFAAGLLADAVENMQQLGWLPFLDHVLWNTSTYLSEDSSVGDLFHSLLGYADQPTVLQFIVWVTYLLVSTAAFIMLGHRQKASARGGRTTEVTSADADVTITPAAGGPQAAAPTSDVDTVLVDAGVTGRTTPDAAVTAPPGAATPPERTPPRA